MEQERCRLRITSAWSALLLGLLTSGCSSTAIPVGQSFTTNKITSAMPLVANVFARAAGKTLSDAQIESFIAPSVVGSDRRLARKIMKIMPPNLRSDFVYRGKDGHLISNNPALLRYISIKNYGTIGSPNRSAGVGRNRSERSSLVHTARSDGDGGACSPPNPPPPSSQQNQTGGPYVRNVSDCGYTAAWGFLNVDCGNDNTVSGDAGHLYFELYSSSHKLTEGGLEYYSDKSVAPYLRLEGVGYVQMINNSVRYGCGQNLAIWHGSTSDGSMTFTETGQVPGSIDPEMAWLTGQIITLNNASYLFENSVGGVIGSGTDGAGFATPCNQCSMSQQTTIAQNNVPIGQYLKDDGSAFGVNPIDPSVNHIHWMQVAFGEWESDCVPYTYLCTFDAGADPSVYFSVAQNFPNGTVSQQTYNDLGYGPYETYNGIVLPGGPIPRETRGAAGAFGAPLAPMPCTADAMNECAIETATIDTGSCEVYWGSKPTVYQSTNIWHAIYHKHKPNVQFLEKAAKKTVYECIQEPNGQWIVNKTVTWKPNEPKSYYNDPGLP